MANRPRRRRKRPPTEPLDLNPAARWRFGIGQSKADNLKEIRAAERAGLGDVYLELARRVERARLSPKGDMGPPQGRLNIPAKKLDTPTGRATISR